MTDAAEPITVQLTPLNNSGESGNAVLTDAGPKTKVVVTIKGRRPESVNPCTSTRGRARNSIPSRPTATTLTGGKSETTIDVPIGDLRKGFAINGHKSAQEASTYVFCGNIPSQ